VLSFKRYGKIQSGRFFFLFWEKKVGTVNGFLTSHLNL